MQAHITPQQRGAEIELCEMVMEAAGEVLDGWKRICILGEIFTRGNGCLLRNAVRMRGGINKKVGVTELAAIL